MRGQAASKDWTGGLTAAWRTRKMRATVRRGHALPAIPRNAPSPPKTPSRVVPGLPIPAPCESPWATARPVPADLRPQIDAINDRIYETVSRGGYKAGFATSQSACEGTIAPPLEV